MSYHAAKEILRWIDDDQADGLKEGKERDGVLKDEQIRRRQGRSHELAGGRIDVSVDAVQARAVADTHVLALSDLVHVTFRATSLPARSTAP